MNIEYAFIDAEQNGTIIPFDEIPIIDSALLEFWTNEIGISTDSKPILFDKSTDVLRIEVHHESDYFRSYIRKLRKVRKLTQIGLSKLSGVSEQYISQIERGVFSASLKTLASLLNVLLFPPVANTPVYEVSVPLTTNIRKKYLAADINSLIKTLSDTNDERILILLKDTLTSIYALKISIETSDTDTDELIENITNAFHQDLCSLK